MASRRTLYVVAVLVTALFASARAEEPTGTLGVFPTALVIRPNAASGSIQLRNDSATESRFQIVAHQWSMSPSAEMQLAPTKDLLVFPTVLALKPGETRSIRIGATVKAAATEMTYRVVIEELGRASEGPSTGVQMLRRLNIPIFLQPASAQLKVDLDRLSIPEPGIATAHVRNRGSVHFVIGEIQLEGQDAEGRPVVTVTRPGWYVLAGDDITYEIPFDATACQRLASIRVSITVRNAPVERLSETAQLSPSGCARR